MDGSGAAGLSDPFGFPSAPGAGGFQNTGFSAGDLASLSPSPTQATAAYGAAGGAPDGAGGFDLSNLGSKALGLLEKNPGVLLSGGLLASQLFRGNQPYPAEQSIQNLATNTGTQGAALSAYINSGTLPPGAQQAVSSATEAAKATTRSRYANLGLTGSTMEAQALQGIDQHAAAQTFQIADQLLAQGADYTKISGSLYNTLLQTQAAQDQEFQKALMTFAGGLGGLRGGGTTA